MREFLGAFRKYPVYAIVHGAMFAGLIWWGYGLYLAEWDMDHYHYDHVRECRDGAKVWKPSDTQHGLGLFGCYKRDEPK